MAKDTGIQWSGLETAAMKDARCSLLLPVLDVAYHAQIKVLPPASKVLVRQDRAAKIQTKDYCARFRGASFMQLVPDAGSRHDNMPITLTVAGRCHFTSENYKDFCIMMRSRKDSETLMHLAPNSEFEWPDVRSLLLCPLCSAMADIPEGTEYEYWMVFYPLLQIHADDEHEMTLATRTICRLVCLDCLSQFIEGMCLTIKRREVEKDVTFSVPAMDMLQEAGTVSFLQSQDGPPRPESHPHVDDPIDAWTLYTLWESTGAWEALQSDYRSALARSMLSDPSPATPRNNIVVMQTKDRYGRKCDYVGCGKVHGKKDDDDTIIRLSIVCKQCKLSYYCSNQCRNAAWAGHSLVCESDKRKAKLVNCDACKKAMHYTHMKKCSRCRSAVYCSVQCQKGDWSQHKLRCKAQE